jgi:XRE family transcriptional regulator, aerobic/anaerobic benzoate catabolism transcriptional regulator
MTQSTETKRTDEPEGEAYLALVGERVRVARSRYGLTRKALSHASGVSERYLADLETGSGNASLLVLRQIGRAIDVAVEDLIADPATVRDDAYDLRAEIHLLRSLTPAERTEARRMIEARFRPSHQHRASRIALIGLRGAGKTTIGRALAAELKWPFIELDREIERTSGMELAEIFASHGQAFFRRKEFECLETTIAQNPSCVIATGGSLVTEPDTYALLLRACMTVWLKASPTVHMARVVAQGDLRPMANNPRAMDDLSAILSARAALYAKADIVLDTTELTPTAACQSLLVEVQSV